MLSATVTIIKYTLIGIMPKARLITQVPSIPTARK